MTGLDEKVDHLVNEVGEIKIALKGYNGSLGLIPAFDEHCKAERKKWRVVYVVFGFLVGIGALEIWGIFS